MRKSALGLIVAGVAASLVMSACSSSKSSDSTGTAAGNSGATTGTSSGGGTVKGKVGVILPDTQSSARWENADKPLLEAAFKAAGVQYDIQNAQGDKSKMASIADAMIQGGVSVLAIVNLDSPSGAQIEAKAASAGVKTIDYDRLTLGGKSDYYVSFDNVEVGKLQGQGLVDCVTAKKIAAPQIIEMNGSPTDNNATLFKQGYDSVLDTKYSSGGWKKVGDKSVADWKPSNASADFEQLLSANSGKVDGVLSANDDMANAIITILKKNKLQVPITGQDATVQGLQNILAGDQCMTVYKAVKKEADGLASLAVALLKGEKGTTTGTTKDATGNREVPSVLLTPQAITKATVKDVIADGFQTKAAVCTGAYAALCTANGVS